ncbi:MAG: VanZ family protein [Chthoniobacteraceae bacterium]
MKSKTLHFLRRLSWGLVIFWAVGIFALSCLSSTEVEKLAPFNLWDKLEHFSAYTAGAFVLAMAIRFSVRWPWFPSLLAAAALISFFGATDEFHQSFTPGRDSDIHDWYADSLGALAGASLGGALYAFAQRKNCFAPSAD